MNRPSIQTENKVAKVLNKKGEVCEVFTFRDHGNSYLSAAQNYLMQNYDKLMAEEVEQMDEGIRKRLEKEKPPQEVIDAISAEHGEGRIDCNWGHHNGPYCDISHTSKPKKGSPEHGKMFKHEQTFRYRPGENIIKHVGSAGIGAPGDTRDYYRDIEDANPNKNVRWNSNKALEKQNMKEEVEQMDESSGDAPIDKMPHKDLADYIGEHPDWVKNNRKEAEKLAHEKTEDLQEKLTSDMSLADVIRDFVHSDNKRFKGKSKEERIDMAKGAYYGMHENKIYTNIISKLEEGRNPTPPKEGKEPSAAWKRYEERLKARKDSGQDESEKKKEPQHIVAQIVKHQDYGYKDHEYTFPDGSKLNVTPEKRDKIIRKIQSTMGPGPGKSSDAREKLYNELNTRKGFLHHTGDEPIPAEKRHPMSAQKR